MNKLLVLLAGLATASAALAQVDPTRPMVTGRGNVNVRPDSVIVTQQTKTTAEETVPLEQFQVTGSLLHPARNTAPSRKAEFQWQLRNPILFPAERPVALPGRGFSLRPDWILADPARCRSILT